MCIPQPKRSRDPFRLIILLYVCGVILYYQIQDQRTFIEGAGGGGGGGGGGWGEKLSSTHQGSFG